MLYFADTDVTRQVSPKRRIHPTSDSYSPPSKTRFCTMRLQTLGYCEHFISHYVNLPRMLYKNDDFCVHTCQRFYQALLISTAMYQTVHEVHCLDNITTHTYPQPPQLTRPLPSEIIEKPHLSAILTGELLRRSFCVLLRMGRSGLRARELVNTMIMSKSRSYQALLFTSISSALGVDNRQSVAALPPHESCSAGFMPCQRGALPAEKREEGSDAQGRMLWGGLGAGDRTMPAQRPSL